MSYEVFEVSSGLVLCFFRHCLKIVNSANTVLTRVLEYNKIAFNCLLVRKSEKIVRNFKYL